MTLAREFPECTPGYSDHTMGIGASVLAVGVGARVIEKHFTIDKNHSDFRDHQLSADPAELGELVAAVREAELLLGDGAKTMQPSEQESATAIRRSIVAGRDLPAGHRLSMDDVIWLRPGGGLDPGEEHRIVGRALRHPVPFGTRINEDDVA
jgi:sialic acid synthase SpsE